MKTASLGEQQSFLLEKGALVLFYFFKVVHVKIIALVTIYSVLASIDWIL